MKNRNLSSLFLHGILIIGLVATVLPFLWMLSTSFKPVEQIFVYPPQWIPHPPILDHFRQLFQQVDFLLHFKNSIIIAAGITFVSLFFSSMAGYAFAKLQFPKREKIFALLLATMMIPGQVTMIPVFLILRNLGLLNTYWGLILPASTSVFGIFLVRQFMRSLPSELIESARIDGCSEFRVYWNIMLPQAMPALATLAIFTFMASWNDFLWPLIVMTKESMYTLPVALANLNGQYNTEWGLLMAGSVVVILPILILFLALQRYFVRGIALTGMKG
ncbi:carbohydrate ABC transporter permease [bacterium]|nr:carbohydrate ABC transporter permease [bacterium]